MQFAAKLILLLSLLLACQQAVASNRFYADNQLEPTDGFAWDWSFGAGYYIDKHYLAGVEYDDGLELDVNIALSYDRFYLDIDNSQLSGGFIIGYNLVDQYNWSLDIISTDIQDGFNEEGPFYNNKKPVDELAGITERKGDFAAGLRLSRRFDDTQISFELLHDISKSHQSYLASGFVSTIVDWQNWEFRFGTGYHIYSSDFTNYYYGVSEQEATDVRPIYQPSQSFGLLFEFHSEYPISEDWVFLNGLLVNWYSSEVTDSPIVDDDMQIKAKIGVRYVF